MAACASGPPDALSTDEHASAETTTDPVIRESLARRARRSASGRAALAPRVNLTAFTRDQWAAALDFPPELVISAAVTGQEVSATIFENGLGIIQPIRGTSFVGLSTGIPGAKEPDGPEPGTDFPPTDSANSAEGDSVTLTLVIHVPPGANRMSLQYNFLSSEYPDFVNAPGTGFNDTFSVKIGDAPAVALAWSTARSSSRSRTPAARTRASTSSRPTRPMSTATSDRVCPTPASPTSSRSTSRSRPTPT